MKVVPTTHLGNSTPTDEKNKFISLWFGILTNVDVQYGCTQRHISFSTTLASHPPLCPSIYPSSPPLFYQSKFQRVLFSRLAPLTTRWQLLLWSRSVMKHTRTPLEIPASGPSTPARINFLKNSLWRKPEWAATRRPGGTLCVCSVYVAARLDQQPSLSLVKFGVDALTIFWTKVHFVGLKRPFFEAVHHPWPCQVGSKHLR